MNLLGFNFLSSVRQRIRSMLAILAISVLCLLCGGLMAFGFAPAQAIHAYRISRLPLTEDAAQVAAAQTGEELLFTGILKGNTPLLEGLDFVAYSVEEWKVTMPSAETRGSSEPSGHWESAATVVPALTLEFNGQPLSLLKANSARLSGDLHSQVIKGTGALQAEDEGELLPDGTRRYRGLFDGDLVTVLGKNSATGGGLPEHLFAGDRLQFEEAQRQAASGMFTFGLCMIAFAPLFLVGGLLFTLFRKS
jgi:hypothetical protein